MTTLVLEFKKIEGGNAKNSSTVYSNSKAEIIINKSDINDVFESTSTYISIISKIPG